jgi:hypothetical protein
VGVTTTASSQAVRQKFAATSHIGGKHRRTILRLSLLALAVAACLLAGCDVGRGEQLAYTTHMSVEDNHATGRVARLVDLLDDTSIREAASAATPAHVRQWSWTRTTSASIIGLLLYGVFRG